MKFTEAIKITQQGPSDGSPFLVVLACGFTPMHLQTFLTAHLQKALPERKIRVETGLYGNLVGTVETPLSPETQAVAIALEWPDLDPRLGYRQTGGWGPADVADMVANSARMLQRLEAALQRVPTSTKAVVCLPTLPLPPVFTTPGWQASEAEMRLQANLLNFAAAIARFANISIVNRQTLDELSPIAGRFDLKAELLTGLCYTMPHADQVGAALARLIHPPAAKKGLITDLDDTFWKGIIGEIGADKVSWDLESHSQIHGLYQQVLRALAEQGVLLAVASKNDLAVAEKGLSRSDVLISADKIFPLEVHWQSKSGSIERILRTWNIGADSVVFVDDSPMELAEVKAAHPAVECLLFPKSDYPAARTFLQTLRDLFGKASITAEDALRLDSIRQGAELQQMMEKGGSAPDDFLAAMNAKLTLDFAGAAADPRALELINKTNQFNLNGRRYTENDWAKDLQNQDTFVVSITYEDKFGSLGKIAVLRGKRQNGALHVPAWVMSCRAFARRIEHQCLRVLFDRFAVNEIHFDFEPTSKNSPLQEFLTGFVDEKLASPVSLKREAFDSRCPVLYHTVITN